MTIPTTITIEQLETLAAQAENDNAAEHARLVRLCKAMARILAARQPEVFRRQATSVTDESGHYDNSYPPDAEYHFAGAPCLIRVRDCETASRPTSSGFYHDYSIYTTDRGLYVAHDGSLFGCDESGTAKLGAYAAHPGTCNRDIQRDFRRITTPTLEDLQQAEEALREKLAEFLADAS